MRRLIVAILLLLGIGAPARTFYINYSQQIDLQQALAHDISILSAEIAATNLAYLKKNGHATYGYLSVVEVAPTATYLEDFRALGIPLLATNAEWKSFLPDIADARWQNFVIQILANRLQHFDGFFLDTVESIETLAQADSAKADDYRAAMVRLIKGLKAAYPNKKIIINRGFNIWRQLTNSVEGVLIESMFHSVHPVTKQSAAVSDSDTMWLLAHANAIKTAGLDVYVLDYVPPKASTLAHEVAQKIRSHGFHALVSTTELDGKILAPTVETARRILVLFGSQEAGLARFVRWPADTIVSTSMQTPLEYLGYELDFLHVVNESVPAELPPGYAAILCDPQLEFPLAKEQAYAEFLIKEKNAAKKIIFTGGFPFLSSEVRRKVFSSFGIQGDGNLITGVSNLTQTVDAELMGFEEKVYLRQDLFFNFQAPVGAFIPMSLRAQKGNGTVAFDPVFMAPWGAVAHRPYLTFRRADFVDYWIINPFDFFRRALDPPNWPIPDVTTRDGVRAIVTHIDGDGLRHKSAVARGKLSTEVIRDGIIKKYPFRFTVSVIESEVRALIDDQKPEDEAVMVALSKSMFVLPNVEAASHTFSHPFYWMADDRTAELYETRNLNLKGGLNTTVNFEKEVKGSVEFINKHLLPPDKSVRIFLWSGNCRPPEEAIRLTRQLGIENMNGGNTIASGKFPTVSMISPRTVPWGKEILVTAPVQNETIFREFEHSVYPPAISGMFVNAIETFQRTENPRRLKPVNIYYHFYSGDNAGGYNALEKLYDWASTNELHSIYASDYARSARDARNTRIFRDGDRWIVVNEGAVRTLRFEESIFPNLKLSRGVTGMNGHYLHTAGGPKTVFAPSAEPPKEIYLVKSTGPIHFDKPGKFSVKDFRPVNVFLGGAFHKVYKVTINGVTKEVASKNQQISLTLPPEATVEVQSVIE